VPTNDRRFQEFINNDRAVNTLINYLQNANNNVETMKWMLRGRPNISVVNMKLMTYNAMKDDEMSKINYEQEIVYNTTYIELLRHELAKKNHKVVILCSIKTSPVADSHAVFIMLDPKSHNIICVDPHMSTAESHEEFENLVETVRTWDQFGMAELTDYNTKFLDDIVATQCSVFQGTFKEKQGLCTLWRIYLSLLFTINDIDGYQEIVDMYERTPSWSQMQIQQFAYQIYTSPHFQSNKNKYDKIGKIQDDIKKVNALYEKIKKLGAPENQLAKTTTFIRELERDLDKEKLTLSSLIGESRGVGKYDCEKKGKIWSSEFKECFDTIQEYDEYMSSINDKRKTFKEEFPHLAHLM
jgi:hypothetical protein